MAEHVLKSMKYMRILLILMISILIQAANPISGPADTFRLYIFEGSDWCPNCLRLDRQVLSSDKFMQGLLTNSIRLEKVDFPQRKKIEKETAVRNDSLATVYEFDGTFPTLILSRTDTLHYARIIYGNQSADQLLEEILGKSQDLHD